MLPVAALAQSEFPRDVTYCWINPAEYLDGSPILVGDLDYIRLLVTRNSGEVVLDFAVPVGANLPGAQQCHNFVGAIPQPGTYTAVAYAVTNEGASSDASNTSEKRFTGKPLPPAGLQ